MTEQEYYERTTNIEATISTLQIELQGIKREYALSNAIIKPGNYYKSALFEPEDQVVFKLLKVEPYVKVNGELEIYYFGEVVSSNFKRYKIGEQYPAIGKNIIPIEL